MLPVFVGKCARYQPNRSRARAVGMLLLTAVSVAAGASAVAAPVGMDYAAEFARNFPAVAGGYQIVDWALYAALVHDDLQSYAVRIDPVVARQREQARGKGYQLQVLETNVKHDQRLRASFDEQRRRIGSMVLYADGNSGATDACQPRLVYVGREFRLVLGGSSVGADPLASATVAPSCPAILDPGFQITAGHSPRFRCWEGAVDRECGWRLPDMPAELKRVIEDEYPTSIRLRWRWRGVGGVTSVRYTDSNGNRVAANQGVVVTTPIDLGLEFVDGKGRIRWTAAGARLGSSAPSDQRP
jgi:hypothetical protein